MEYTGILLFELIVFLLIWKSGFCADAGVRVGNTYPKTVIVNGMKTLIAQKSSDILMPCIVVNKPQDSTIQWMIQNFQTQTSVPLSQDTQSSDPYKYTVDKPASNVWRLKLQNVQVSDEALYICRTQLGSQRYVNDSRHVRVVESPQIIDIFTSSDRTVNAGDPVFLTCNASGIPHPQIIWRRLGGGVLPSGGRQLYAYEMTAKEAQPDHRGWYKCTAKNSAGEDSRMIRLDVKYHPNLKPESTPVLQAPGYLKELVCIISGNPVPKQSGQIIWSKDDVILTDQTRYKIENSYGSVKVITRLIIQRVESQDYGRYKCSAENEKGYGQAFVDLLRSEEPTPDRRGQIRSAADRIQHTSFIHLYLLPFALLIFQPIQ